MNKLQVMFINAMYLTVTPKLMQVTTVFTGMDDILENAMSNFLMSLNSESNNGELTSVFDDKLDTLIDDIMLQIQADADELLENYENKLQLLVIENKLLPALNCIEHFTTSTPLLMPLDKPLLRKDLIEYLSFVKKNNGVNSTELHEFISCFQSIFDDLKAKRYQKQQDELKIESWFDAAAKNDVSTLTSIIESGIDIDIANVNRKTALDIATINNNVEAVRLLLTHKENQKQLCDDDSPAYIAIENNSAEILKLIIENDSDCLNEYELKISFKKCIDDQRLEIFKLLLKNFPSKIDLTSIAQVAIQENHFEILKYLFEQGLDPDSYNNTEPLTFVALTSNNIDALQLFIDNGANINAVNYVKKTLLESTLVNSSDLMIEYLISQGITFDIEPFEWSSVFDNVKKMANIMSWKLHDCLRIVVNDIKKIDSNGWNLLHHIVNQNHSNKEQVKETVRLCDFLINDVGFDINQLTENKENCALTLTHTEIIFDYLLHKKPDINIQLADKLTLLPKLLKQYEGRAFRKLIASGIDLDIVINGQPLLHYVFIHNVKLVSYLTEQGCDINVKDSFGFSILQNNISNCYTFEKNILMFAKLGADFNCISKNKIPLFHILCALYDVELVKEIMSSVTIDIHVYDKNENNATMQASLAGNIPNVILLAHAGVDINHKNIVGSTPLLHAIYNDDADLVTCLINHCDADIAIELAGNNIIDLAKQFNSKKVFILLQQLKVLNAII